MQPRAVGAVNANSDPMIPNIIRINKIVWETEDTFTIHLNPNVEFGGGFNFKPGQFNMIYVFGVGESAISISSSPYKPKTLIHTIRRVGTITTALSKLKAGSFIGLRGPFGNSWPVENAIGKDVCIVAGGIGLAPLRPVIYSVLKNRRDYGKIFILYGARSPLDLLYRVELEQWSKQYNVEVQVTVDHGDSSWKGNIGVVSNLFNYITLDTNNTVAMICGPEIMMKFTVMELLELGRSDDGIGIVISRRIRERIGEKAKVIDHNGNGVSLMEEWKNHNKVILIDAVTFGGSPGTIHFINAVKAQIIKETKQHSSHLFSVADAIETARALKSLPSEIYIYGIEGQSFEMRTNISEEVMKASDEVINKIILDFTT